MKNVKMVLGIVLLTIGVSCSKADDPTPVTLPVSTPPTTDVTIAVVNIPAGTFIMGSPIGEPDRFLDEVQHSVSLSAYRMSKYEINNVQYAAFLNAKSIGSNGIWATGPYPTQPLIYTDSTMGLVYTGGQWVSAASKANAPVVKVTWYGAASFAQYVGGRLPTEAEWEYAARANTTTSFSTGTCLSNTQANYNWAYAAQGCTNAITTSPGTTQIVGSYPANAYGLYDMQGNVWEWCADWYGAYPTSAVSNPTGPVSGSTRVSRGGSWSYFADPCRSALRYPNPPTFYNNSGGIRVVF